MVHVVARIVLRFFSHDPPESLFRESPSRFKISAVFVVRQYWASQSHERARRNSTAEFKDLFSKRLGSTRAGGRAFRPASQFNQEDRISMKYINRVILAMAVAALGLAAILTSGPSVAPAATSTTLPAFGHVVIVIGENTDYSSSVGGMTYLDSLANTYGLATNYHADTHPSIGNYFMLTTGQIITNNDSQTPSSLGLSTSQDNIAYEVQKAGKTWKDYEESTNGCGALNSGSYIVRHDPLVYFPNINTESANFVCMSQFSSDVSAGTLPNLSWLSPNGCDDAHDCSLSTLDGFLVNYLTLLWSCTSFT